MQTLSRTQSSFLALSGLIFTAIAQGDGIAPALLATNPGIVCRNAEGTRFYPAVATAGHPVCPEGLAPVPIAALAPTQPQPAPPQPIILNIPQPQQSYTPYAKPPGASDVPVTRITPENGDGTGYSYPAYLYGGTTPGYGPGAYAGGGMNNGMMPFSGFSGGYGNGYSNPRNNGPWYHRDALPPTPQDNYSTVPLGGK